MNWVKKYPKSLKFYHLKFSFELKSVSNSFKSLSLDHIAHFDNVRLWDSGAFIELLYFIDVDWGEFFARVIDLVLLGEENGNFAGDGVLTVLLLKRVRVVVDH